MVEIIFQSISYHNMLLICEPTTARAFPLLINVGFSLRIKHHGGLYVSRNIGGYSGIKDRNNLNIEFSYCKY